MRSGSRFFAVILATLCLLVAGCSSEEFSDLRSYVNKVRATQKGHIEPLPEFKPFETYAYSSTADKDPFEPWVIKGTGVAGNGSNGVRPNFDRRKESLEAFPLDSLRMVGTVNFNSQQWAVIKAPDGIVYRIKTGNYMGQHNGRVLRIKDQRVVLREIVPNGMGGWEKRQAELAITE